MNSARENRFFETYSTLNIDGRLIDLRTPRIMGILNVTPDSFFDGGRYGNETAMLKQAELMLQEGGFASPSLRLRHRPEREPAILN